MSASTPSPERLHRAILTATDNAGKSIRTFTQQLRDGRLPLAEWQAGIAAEIKAMHLAAAIVAVGGRENMTQSHYGRVGQIIRQEYRYLREFANGIADGSVPLDGRVLVRAEAYMRDGRETYSVFERLEMQRRGYDQERNVRDASDSCDECIELEDAGWVDLGTTPPPGSRTCRSNCRCRIEYRRAA